MSGWRAMSMIATGLCAISMFGKVVSLHLFEVKARVDNIASRTHALLKRLLNEGMDVNVAAWRAEIIWHNPSTSSAKGALKVMDALLERAVNIDARTKRAFGWIPLQNVAKERKKKAIRFLVENGAFLPGDINNTRFNPPLHYCSGLEWAYEKLRRLQLDSTFSGETSCGSDN